MKRYVSIILAIIMVIISLFLSYGLLKKGNNDEDLNNPTTTTKLVENDNEITQEDEEITTTSTTEVENSEEITTSKKEDDKEKTTSKKELDDEKTTTSKKSSNSSKEDKTTTTSKNNKTTSKTTKTTTTKLKVVKTEAEEKVISEETKYGVKIKTVQKTIYDIYSDGTKKEKTSSEKTSYDYDGFNAKTGELKSEATSLTNSNWSTIKSVFNYVNTYRNEVGEKALTLDKNLSVAATIRALEMAWGDKFSHTRPNGEPCFTVLDELSISYYTSGENIAAGQSSAKAVSEAWKASKGHYENMINSSYGKIGIGVVTHRGRKYWVQFFTN